MAKSLTEAAKEILDASRGKNAEARKTLEDPNASVDTKLQNSAPVSKNTPSGGEAKKTPENPDSTATQDLGGEDLENSDIDDKNPDASSGISKSVTKVNDKAVSGEGRKNLDSGNPATPGQEGKGALAPFYHRYESLEAEVGKQIAEDLGALLDEEGLPDGFKNKALVIFEAAIISRVNAFMDTLEEDFAKQLEEATEIIKEDIGKKTNDYLSYVVEEWMSENEIAVEKALRTELTEDFISGLRQLFTEHYIDVPEDKVNIVEELTSEVATLEEKLNAELAKNVKLNEEKRAYQMNETLATAAEGLTDVQKDKFKSLAEGVEFTTEGEYSEKLKLIRENYFSTSEVKVDEVDGGLNNEVIVEDASKASTKSQAKDPAVAAIADLISRSVK